MTTSTTPNIQGTASPYQIKGLPNWVWRSTDASIKKAQFSVLAVIEIPLAILLYYWLASCLKQTSAWSQGLVIFYLFATPLLLLRSDASVALGKKWLHNYHEKTEPSNLELWLMMLLTGVVTFVVFYYLAEHYLSELNNWHLFWGSFSLAIVAGGVACMMAIEQSRYDANRPPFSVSAISVISVVALVTIVNLIAIVNPSNTMDLLALTTAVALTVALVSAGAVAGPASIFRIQKNSNAAWVVIWSKITVALIVVVLAMFAYLIVRLITNNILVAYLSNISTTEITLLLASILWPISCPLGFFYVHFACA